MTDSLAQQADILSALAWLMTISAGIMAGIYFTFSIVIMRSLSVLSTRVAVDAMNSINREILKTSFMPFFFGSTFIALILVITAIWHWGTAGYGQALTAGIVYITGMFLTTAIINVPLNNRLDRVSGADLAAGDLWAEYFSRWTRWNTVRALACTVTMIICIDLIHF